MQNYRVAFIRSSSRRASISWGGNILLLEHVQVHSTTGPESRTQAVNHFRLNLHPLPATASCAALAPFFSELKRNEAASRSLFKARRGARTCPSAWLSSGHSCHRNPARRRRPERHRRRFRAAPVADQQPPARPRQLACSVVTWAVFSFLHVKNLC